MSSQFGGVAVDSSAPSGSKFGGVPVDAQQPDSAASRFGSGLYSTTLAPIVHLFTTNPVDSVVSMFKGAIGADDLKAIKDAAEKGDYKSAAVLTGHYLTTNPVQRQADAMGQDVERSVRGGDYAGAAGKVLGDAVMLGAPIVGEASGAFDSLANAAGTIKRVATDADVVREGVKVLPKGGQALKLYDAVQAAKNGKAVPQVYPPAGEPTLPSSPGAREVPPVYPAAANYNPVEGLMRPSAPPAAPFRPGPSVPSEPVMPAVVPARVPPPLYPAAVNYDPQAGLVRPSVVPPPASPVSAVAPAPAVAAVAASADQELLDGISQSLAKKPFAKLSAPEQATVKQIASRGATSMPAEAAPAPQPAQVIPIRPSPSAIITKADLAKRALADEMLKSGTASPEMMTPPADATVEEVSEAGKKALAKAFRPMPEGMPTKVADASYAGDQNPQIANATYEAAGRAEKSQALSQMLHDEGLSSRAVAKWTDEDWAKATDDRGLPNAFSKASQGEVITRLRRIERLVPKK